MSKKKLRFANEKNKLDRRITAYSNKALKYSQLDKEKHLSSDYTTIERNALKYGFHPKPISKPKPKKKKKRNPDVPKIEKCEYPVFLLSKYWLYVRKLVIERDNKECQHCAKKRLLHVHHLTYKNHYKEHLHLGDLITLCNKCHEKIHGLV